MDYKNCRQLKTDKLIVVEENKKKFTLDNQNRKNVYQVKVDGCLITEGRKCDYLFEIDGITKVYYVELKGKDISHAFKQLESTVEFCNSTHQKILRECHIVGSSSPKSSTTIQILQKKLKDKYGIKSFIHTQQAIIKC
jgi:uncharacterized protein YyaL (SSP411 family)